jgi:predicted neuraminidase
MPVPDGQQKTGGSVNVKRLRPRDYVLALGLLVAFTLAGSKIFTRLPAANFQAAQTQQTLSSLGAPGKAASTLPAAGLPEQLSQDGRFRFNAQFVSGAPGQAVHAASLVELNDGRLQAVWFSGSREGAGDVTIQTAVMDRSMQLWGAERTLFDRQQIERGLWRYVKKLGNPVIARAPDGSLMLWMVTVSLGGWAGSSITWSRSIDEGINWSVPGRLVTSPFLNISTLVKSMPVALADGQIALPVYHEFAAKFGEMLRIDPHGQVVDKTRIPGSQTSLQPVMLVTGPERAKIYMRSTGVPIVKTSRTDDAGQTWSSAQASNLPNPDSALAGVVTGTGEQWLALNPTPAGRETLALLKAGSDGRFDGASALTSALVVEPSTILQGGPSIADYERQLGDELKAQGASGAQVQAYVASARRQLCGQASCAREFSYPYLLQSRDGYIHLVYTWHRTRIKHVRLDPMQPLLAASATVVAPKNAPPAN